MNIFYLHPDPLICAEQHCDAHVTKMAVETAQLLSTAHRVVDGEMYEGRTTKGHRIKRYFHPDTLMNEELYKVAHINHPSTKWVRQSAANYNWLYELWANLCAEYTYRYGRTHESWRKLEYLLLLPPMQISDSEFTQPTPAMKQYPECIVEGDSIQSYRNFYWADKREFAKWTKRDKPEWWTENEREGRQTETVNG